MVFLSPPRVCDVTHLTAGTSPGSSSAPPAHLLLPRSSSLPVSGSSLPETSCGKAGNFLPSLGLRKSEGVAGSLRSEGQCISPGLTAGSCLRAEVSSDPFSTLLVLWDELPILTPGLTLPRPRLPPAWAIGGRGSKELSLPRCPVY